MSDAKNAKTIAPMSEMIGPVFGGDDFGERALSDLTKTLGTLSAARRRQRQRKCSNRGTGLGHETWLSMAASVSVSL